MPGDIRLGIIGRADNTGLGVETWEFCRHFPEAKVMIVEFESLYPGEIYKIYPERFNKPVIVTGIPTESQLEAFFEGIDVLFTIETPYYPKAFEIARRVGVKSILRVNYEWFRDYRPDFYISPILYHYNEIPGPKAFIPFPINREVLPFKLRKKANKFIHIAGNMKAAYDRNGTELFLKAIPYIKSNIEIVIKSQVPIESISNRYANVRVDVCDYENYWEIWEDADVLVLPRRYAGQSLPLNEAMSRGMAIIMTDLTPQNQFLPKELLIKPLRVDKLMINREIEIADIDPKEIAKKIDEIAGKDITKYSKISNHIAQAWSWENLKDQYVNLFNRI
jgi:glycosyltransferase involved in cell wall biosynthesis